MRISEFQFVLFLIVLATSCSRSKIIVETEEPSTSSPATEEPVGTSDDVIQVIEEEEVPVEEETPAEEPVQKFVDFTVDAKFMNEDHPFGGNLDTCNEADFALLTVSDVDPTKVWVCDKDDNGAFFWTPQLAFREAIVGDPDVVMTVAKPQSFAFEREGQVFWGWYYPSKGTVFEVEVEAYDVFVNTEVDGEIVRSVFLASFTAFTRNTIVTINDNDNDLPLSLMTESDGVNGSFKIVLDEIELFEVKDFLFELPAN